MTRLLFFIFLLSNSFSSAFSQTVYDTIILYPGNTPSFIRTKSEKNIREYSWYENRHLKSYREIHKSYQGGKDTVVKICTFYEDGKMELDSTKMNSIVTSNYFNKEGTLLRYTWKNTGKISVPVTEKIITWDKNGEMSYMKVTGENGKIIVDEKYPLDQLKDLEFYRTYYPDGSLKDQGFYRNGNDGFTKIKFGAWFHFFPNNQLQTAGYYFNDQPYGLHFTYDSTGKIIDSVYYTNGKPDPDYQKNLESYKTDYYDQYETGHRTKSSLVEGVIFHRSEYMGQQTAGYYFYYKGEVITQVPYAAKDSLKNVKQVNFTFAFPEIYRGSMSYYLSLDGNYLKRSTSYSIDHHSYACYTFDEKGNTLLIRDASGREIRLRENGKLYCKYHGVLNPEFTTRGVVYTSGLRDTAIYYSQAGIDSVKFVYGYWGMATDTLRSENGKWVDRKNTKLQNLVIEIMPGVWFESIDYYIELPGYWKKENANGIVYAEGNFGDFEYGQWIERSTKTGEIISIQQLDKNGAMGKGLYERYDENGKLLERGYYGDNQKREGVWKAYDEKGRLRSKSVYKNGVAVGTWICKSCCKKKNGKRRLQITKYRNGKEVWRLRKKCGIEIY